MNACGGCNVLSATPDTACGQCGTWRCDGTSALRCDDPGRNACNGCAVLQGSPTLACGQCGRWACSGTESVVCNDPGRNACNGCGTLTATPGSTCEVCGTWQCSTGGRLVICVGGDANACGGCTALSGTPGDTCGTCGTWSCADANTLACSNPGIAYDIDATFTSLAGFHEVCNGVSDAVGPDCNAAIHRFCSNRCGANSGFGAVEIQTSSITLTCVTGNVFDDTYTNADQQAPGCDGVSERFGINCHLAIHRLCRARGFITGHGPVENSGDLMYYTCLSNASLVDVSYATLDSYISGCNGYDSTYGEWCNAAIHRHCLQLGYESGFGPVEWVGGGVVTIACVR